jgi:hypothetical protein
MQALPAGLGTWVSFPLEGGTDREGPPSTTARPASRTRTLPIPTGTRVWPWSQCQGRGGRCFNVQQRPLCGFVRRLLNSIMQSACLYLARLLARAVVTLSTVIEPGVRATALRYATNVVPAAALGSSFTRSFLATNLHVEREANTFVAVRRRHAASQLLCRDLLLPYLIWPWVSHPSASLSDAKLRLRPKEIRACCLQRWVEA